MDVLKYLASEIGTPTIILVVGMEMTNFRVCEEERAAHVNDEDAYMWWPHLPSFN